MVTVGLGNDRQSSKTAISLCSRIGIEVQEENLLAAEIAQPTTGTAQVFTTTFNGKLLKEVKREFNLVRWVHGTSLTSAMKMAQCHCSGTILSLSPHIASAQLASAAETTAPISLAR